MNSYKWYCHQCVDSFYFEIFDYLEEFRKRDELVGFLEFMNDVGVCDWLQSIKEDDHTKYYCLFKGHDLVSMFRITPMPRYAANGSIGYSILPSERGKGYSKIMMKYIIDESIKNDLKYVTACVAEDNNISAHVLESNEFKKTGRSFTWLNGKTAIEYIRILESSQP